MRHRIVRTILTMLFPFAQASDTNPISKVLQMVSDLQGTVVSQVAEAQKSYEKYVAYCQERSQSVGFEIKNGKANKDSLQADVESETADIKTLTAKIEDLSAEIDSNDNDLKRAAALREKEAADFALEDHDLKDILDSLERAISQFSKQSPAALLQKASTNSVTDALSVMVNSLAMSVDDASKLSALIQEHSLASTDESESDDDADLELGAPAAAAHERKTGSVVSTLESLYERAESQLSKVREGEAKARQNYQELRQSLTNQLKLEVQDMREAKFRLSESREAKAVSTGDLEMTAKDVERDLQSKEVLHHECMTVAEEFQADVSTREEELKALTAVKKAIEDSSDAAEQTYMTQMSFAQLGARKTSQGAENSPRFQVVHFVRRLATKIKSPALSQLAVRMSSALRLGSVADKDPFEKVRGLIENMILQLENEGDDEGTHKAYCDKQLAETDANKEDTSAQLDHIGSKLNQKKARSVKLKEQIRTLRKELATIEKAKGEAAQLRQQQRVVFKKNKVEMEQGLDGIRRALQIMKEHYGKAHGAEGGITSLLEILESDFSKGVAGMIVDEEGSAHFYASEIKQNFDLETAAKEHDVQHKMKLYISMDKVVSEFSSDLSSTQSKLDAVREFDKTLRKTCVSGPQTYAERKGRREQELSGLREAAQSIDGTTSLLELGSSHKLRGAQHHKANK